MQSVGEFLSDLASRQGSTTIIYYGGKKPGAKRRIAPLIVTQEVAHARDLDADEIMTYVLAKIDIVDDYRWDYLQRSKTGAPTPALLTTVEALVPELESLGWKVTLGDDIVLLHAPRRDDAAVAATIGMRHHAVQAVKTSSSAAKGAAGSMASDNSWYVFGPHFGQFSAAANHKPGQPDRGLESALRFLVAQAREYAPVKQV